MSFSDVKGIRGTLRYSIIKCSKDKRRNYLHEKKLQWFPDYLDHSTEMLQVYLHKSMKENYRLRSIQSQLIQEVQQAQYELDLSKKIILLKAVATQK